MVIQGTKQLDLPCGPIIARCHDGLLYARGIKYAEAGRFEKPVPATWTSTRDCTGPAVVAPQPPTRIAPVVGDVFGGRPQSEDCLHVVVASPDHAKDLPVMVFFHGGAYVSGGGDLDIYNPSGLAREGIVAVNVSYRVGHFGYLPVPSMAPANLGLLDQIEALRWVQNNISAFGGDPAEVTIYGQSAGGDSVFCLMLCEETRCMFQRCIIQSAPMGRFDEPAELRAQLTSAMGDYVSKVITSSEQPLSTEEYLALLPELMTIASSIHESLAPLAPILGESPLPPQSQVKQKLQEVARRVPIFVGYTSDEGTPFAFVDPGRTAVWYHEKVFKDGSDRLREDIAEAAGTCPSYEFVWHPKGSRWGSAHCIELPFLLGGLEAWKSSPMLDGSDKEAVFEKLGPQMKKLWATFARGGDLCGRRFVIDEDFVFNL